MHLSPRALSRDGSARCFQTRKLSVSSVLAKNPSPDINGLSFETVFEGYFDYVSHTLRCLGVHVSDLEDVVHDVFVQVYRHYAQYDVTRPIKPWLYCFAYRSARDYRGSARVRRVVAKDEILEEDSAPGPARAGRALGASEGPL